MCSSSDLRIRAFVYVTWGGGSLKKRPELPRPRTLGRVDQKVTDNLIADSVARTVDQLQNRPHAKHLGWKYITSYAENFETRLVRKLPRSSVQGPYHSYGVSSWVTPGQPIKRLVRVAPLAGHVQIRYFKKWFYDWVNVTAYSLMKEEIWTWE